MCLLGNKAVIINRKEKLIQRYKAASGKQGGKLWKIYRFQAVIVCPTVYSAPMSKATPPRQQKWFMCPCLRHFNESLAYVRWIMKAGLSELWVWQWCGWGSQLLVPWWRNGIQHVAQVNSLGKKCPKQPQGDQAKLICWSPVKQRCVWICKTLYQMMVCLKISLSCCGSQPAHI